MSHLQGREKSWLIILEARRRSTEVCLAAAGFLYDAALASARFERRASRAARSSVRHKCCALSFGLQL
jgi:hypothetical protein